MRAINERMDKKDREDKDRRQKRKKEREDHERVANLKRDNIAVRLTDIA